MEDPAVTLPRGTRVTLNRSSSSGEALVFATTADATIPQGATQVEILAHHCDLIEGEFAGSGTGLPGLSIQAQRPPIIAPTGDRLDLVVGIEAEPGELGERSPAIEYEGKTYRIWREVENFTNVGDDPHAYLVDRMSGVITFAPAARLEQRSGELDERAQALAAIPGARREIRLWYRRGGGPEGNIEANTLTQLKDAFAGIQVTNPDPATGGRAAETLENALVRGPQQLHSLRRAITARDFELVVLHNSQAIARAKALTQAALWTYATPGTVEVLLVPYIPEEKRGGGQLTEKALQTYQTEETRAFVQQTLDQRRPLGTTCRARWARYKSVHVRARIVVRREEDLQAVRQRVIERLYQTINPLPTQFSSTGWLFGQALRASHVYDIALAEPGVRWVDQVRLVMDEVPDENVTAIIADDTQPKTWYVGSGSTFFRSLNDGDGWEVAGRFTDEEIIVMRTHPGRPGLIAVATQLAEGDGSHLYISWDCAETWDSTPYAFGFQVQGLAWITRDGEPVLLIASSVGLYELSMQAGSSPLQVLVDQSRQTLGFYAVVASTDATGGVNYGPAAALGPDGRIYVIGGFNSNNILNTVEAYNPRTNTWTKLAPVPTPSFFAAAVSGPDGHIYVMGGVGPGFSTINTVESYDISTNTWTTVASMPTARYGLAAVLGKDGQIYAIGGVHGGILSTVEAYSSTTHSWTEKGAMLTPRVTLAAAVGQDGRIYAIGGNGPGGAPQKSVEAYNPDTNSWTAVASLPAANYLLAAAPGPDGRIYTIGGLIPGGAALQTVEVYDTTTNSWTPPN